jgi:hypothetical protein
MSRFNTQTKLDNTQDFLYAFAYLRNGKYTLAHSCLMFATSREKLYLKSVSIIIMTSSYSFVSPVLIRVQTASSHYF